MSPSSAVMPPDPASVPSPKVDGGLAGDAAQTAKASANNGSLPPVVKPRGRIAELQKSDPGISPRTGKPKRRKALRACVHCQRTHLTCDNGRPCERCIVRGLAATCRDGTRKKAKYLREDGDGNLVPDETSEKAGQPQNGSPASQNGEERGQLVVKPKGPQVNFALGPSNMSPRSTASPIDPLSRGIYPGYGPAADGHDPRIPARIQSMAILGPNHVPQGPQGPQGPPGAPSMAHVPMAPAALGSVHNSKRFQSAATDLEYSSLSSMLQRESHGGASEGSASSPSFSDDSSYAISQNGPRAFGNQFASDFNNQYMLDTVNIDDLMVSHESNSPLSDWLDQPKPPPISLMVTDTLGSTGRNTPAPSGLTKTPLEIYRDVRKPFPYTPGFHSLIRYLKQRFRKPELMQIVQSMAKYRPSFIAYSNSLTEDDLVFVEQCFQRALLEYEKYFAYWGTPTVIWRRTGQIAAVGAEFGMLTGWGVDDLLESNKASGGPGRFIVELMDDKSAVEYFRLFSTMSFGDSRGTAMTDCTLLTPHGKTIRTSSVLTLKRDLFGIPMLIIGNFLPVLTKN